MAEITRTLKFTMPCSIPHELNPNWQYHGPGQNGLRATAMNTLKEFGYFCALDARNRWERANNAHWEPLETAVISVLIVLGPHMKEWDETNARAALKHAEDMWTMSGFHKTGADILRDDKPANVTWSKIQWRRGEDAAIEVEISEG